MVDAGLLEKIPATTTGGDESMQTMGQRGDKHQDAFLHPELFRVGRNLFWTATSLEWYKAG